MSRERELLAKALDALEKHRLGYYLEGPDLIVDIRAELQRPEPVECGTIIVKNEYKYWHEVEYFNNMPDGKYRLFAEKIQDD